MFSKIYYYYYYIQLYYFFWNITWEWRDRAEAKKAGFPNLDVYRHYHSELHELNKQWICGLISYKEYCEKTSLLWNLLSTKKER